MSGFGGFGSPSTGGGFFGAKPPDQPTSGFTIPTTTTATTATTATGSFGTPTFGVGGTGGLFGTQQQTSAFGTGFGIKSTTTAGATPTGFTFGTSTPNPGFGASSTSTPAFSIPASGVTPTFSTPSTSAAVPTFGAPANTTVPTFGTFGTSNTLKFGTTGLNTGTPKTTATTGLTFPSTSSTPAAAPSFSFGVSSTATTPGTLTFGISTTTTSITTTSSTAPTLSFGIQPTGTTATTTTTSTATATATGFTFTQPSTTGTLTFGTPKTTGGFTFGTPTTTTAATTTKGLTFNLGTSTTTPLTLGTGLFGTQKTDGITITTTTTSVGLGGIDKAQTAQGLSGSGTLEPKQAKDHTLPDPILQTLNDFQNFTKQQKSISVEISHGSSKPLKKVQEDTEAIESLLMTITSGLTKNAIAVDKLKTETAQGLHQAEMAQRNHETPPGLEYDNSAPSDYFNDLVTKFETDTVRLKVQIETSEKHLRSLTQCSTISPQELTIAMRRLHETLIVLAGRVQALHTTVQSQKEQFKNLRRVYFKDDTNIFESESDQSRTKKKMVYSLRSLTGPTPFSETPGPGLPLNVDGLAMLASSASPAAGASPATSSIPTTSSNPSWLSPLRGSPNLNLNSGGVLRNVSTRFDVLGLKLETPPAGNKRSKR